MDQQQAFFSRIFDHLSKGLFLYAGSHRPQLYQQYVYVKAHEAAFEQALYPLGFQLEKGKDYYYLSRPHKPIIWEDRKTRIFRLLDIVDFFYAYDPAWGPGKQLREADLVAACASNPVLSHKLKQLRLPHTSEASAQKLPQMLKWLEKGGFAECLDEAQGHYWMSPAYRYLDQMFQALYLQI